MTRPKWDWRFAGSGIPIQGGWTRRCAAPWRGWKPTNADGGWGEDLRSYGSRWIGKRRQHASQTALGLMALLETDQDSPAVARGVDYLLRTQRQDYPGTLSPDTGRSFPGASGSLPPLSAGISVDGIRAVEESGAGEDGM